MRIRLLQCGRTRNLTNTSTQIMRGHVVKRRSTLTWSKARGKEFFLSFDCHEIY